MASKQTHSTQQSQHMSKIPRPVGPLHLLRRGTFQQESNSQRIVRKNLQFPGSTFSENNKLLISSSSNSSLSSVRSKNSKSNKSPLIVKPVSRPSASIVKRRYMVVAADKKIAKSRIPVRIPSKIIENRLALLEAREVELINNLRDIRKELDHLKGKRSAHICNQKLNQIEWEKEDNNSLTGSPSAFYVRPPIRRDSFSQMSSIINSSRFT